MQSLFNVTSMETDYSNKKILVKTTFAVDPKTVNRKNVEVIAASSGTAVTYKVSVDNDIIVITLKDWPLLDDYYVVKIQNVKDKLDRDLTHPITKQVTFKADTKLKIIILEPKNNQAISRFENIIDFSIKVINPDNDETIDSKDEEDIVETPQLPEDGETNEAMTEDELNVKYHFEFASDIAFFDIVKTYETEYTNGSIQLENGQYYMRARAIENGLEGDWSDTITFTVVPAISSNDSDEISQNKKDYIDEIMSPVEFFLENEEEFEVVSYSNNGVTYPEFYIEFNKPIDITKLPKEIITYRRDL